MNHFLQDTFRVGALDAGARRVSEVSNGREIASLLRERIGP